VTVTSGTRVERKERTRRAILDAALELCETQPLAALSLRQVAKEVGIVPTAFYRHFESIEDLGLVLVDESFTSLRDLLRAARTFETPPANDRALFHAVADNSVKALVTHVPLAQRHFRFIARERLAGPAPVREAVRHQLELIERELATDIARVPGAGGWTPEDLRILANLLVSAMLTHAEELALAGNRPDVVRRVESTARRQLRMVLIGALDWDSSHGA
jgi:AcrR family transcriptional regulator